MESNKLNEKTRGKIAENANLYSKTKTRGFEILLSTLIITLILTIIYGITSIKSSIEVSKEQKWEYKTVTVKSPTKNNRIGTGSGDFNLIELSESQLNELGLEGWELVNSYLEMETAYPNFGDQKYANGTQPNIRPQDVVLIFKRPIKAK